MKENHNGSQEYANYAQETKNASENQRSESVIKKKFL